MNGFRRLHIEDINFRSVVRDVLRSFWVIVLAAASAWMLANVWCTVTYEAEYTSTATLSVSSAGSSNSLSNLSTTTGMAEMFSSVFESDILSTQVAAAMGKTELDAEISAGVISSTNLLRVTVVAGTPEDAFRTLTATLENYGELAETIFTNVVLTVIKEPNVPMSPSNSVDSGRISRNAALIGALAAILILAFFSASRETIQTRAAAAHQLEGSMFGSISHDDKNVLPAEEDKDEKRRGASLPGRKRGRAKSAALITNPLVSYHFQEDCQRLCTRFDYYMQTHNRKILLISSAAENEGKSTIAANLALGLADRGRKVLLLDLDFRKPSQHKIFEVGDDDCADFVTYLMNPRDVKPSSVFVRRNGVTLAVDRKNYSQAQHRISEKRIRSFLNAIQGRYDYIILDSPPMLVATDAEAQARLADEVLLVVRQDWSIVRDINDCIDIMRRSEAHYLGYVLNNMQTRRQHESRRSVHRGKRKPAQEAEKAQESPDGAEEG